MAKTAQRVKKTDVKSLPAASPAPRPRRLKKPHYKSFTLQKRIKPERKLPGAFRLLWQAFGLLKRNWKLFASITLVYGVLNFILVQGFSTATNVGQLKDSIGELFNGDLGAVATTGALFLYMLGSVGSNATQGAGAYQFILIIGTSLALIWALRQVYGGIKIRARQAFYAGMFPLVPFLLVLLMIVIHLIPIIIAAYLYSTVSGNAIATTAVEKLLWGVLLFLFGLLSLYFVSSSVFALYIVSLPDMTPMRALRSAKQLVRYRRAAVMRKLLFLPAALLVLSAVIMLPLILFVTPVAGWVFLVMTMCLLPIIHSYIYGLYRSLL